MQLARLSFLLAAAAAWSATAPAVAQTYTLDPAHSWVQFEVMHFGTSTTRGRLGPVSGTVTLDRPAGRGEVQVRVATASVDTGMGFFNARLRAADLLASEAHPEAFFVATQWQFDGQKVASVRGEFTLRGVSQPLTLRATQFACRDTPEGEVCGGDFEGTLQRSDFGLDFGLPFVANRVGLRVQVEALRQR
jgi:polyisoprenoid-binding protein YceI